MGDIIKITGKEVLPDPEGWNITKEQFNLPFTVELKENFHIHWHDLRIEMMPKDFEKFAKAITKAYQKWEDDGKPQELDNMKRYGFWEGEEDYQFYKDRDKKFTPSGELCHHFQKFPRTEGGNLFFDTVFQVELQKVGQYHIHYKNLRIELGKNRLKQMTKALQDTVNDMSKN